MRAVVTGANGFVGKYLVEKLAERGYEVWAVIRNEAEDISGIAPFYPHVVLCDLKDFSSLHEKIPHAEFECFYHLAWAGSSGSARADYQMQLRNAAASGKAAEAAAKIGCRRFAGAGSVTQMMYGEYLKKDGSTPEMTACYAAAKNAAEGIARCVCTEYGIDFLWGYLSNFYGAGDRSGNIINFLIGNYRKGIVPELTDGRQKADLMYVSDVAEALLALGERGRAGCTYYIGYGEPRPLREFVLQVRDCVNPGLDSGLGRKAFGGLDIDFSGIDAGKLHRDTGFSPEVCFEEGIRKTVEWQEKGGNGWI